MVLNGSMLREVEDGLRSELQHVRHHGEINVQAPKGLRGRLTPQRGQLKDAHPALLGRYSQRIGVRAGLFRGAEHARNHRTAGEESVQHALPESLLSDDGQSHGSLAWVGSLRVASHYR